MPTAHTCFQSYSQTYLVSQLQTDAVVNVISKQYNVQGERDDERALSLITMLGLPASSQVLGAHVSLLSHSHLRVTHSLSERPRKLCYLSLASRDTKCFVHTDAKYRRET